MNTVTHPRPLVQGRSGNVYCALCLASAHTVDALDHLPCRDDSYYG